MKCLKQLGVPKPYISYRFPPAEENKKDNLADAIVQFCFPEAELWIGNKHAEEKKKEYCQFHAAIFYASH